MISYTISLETGPINSVPTLQALSVTSNLQSAFEFIARTAAVVACFLACQSLVCGGYVFGPTMWEGARQLVIPAFFGLVAAGSAYVASRLKFLKQRFYFVDYVHAEKD